MNKQTVATPSVLTIVCALLAVPVTAWSQATTQPAGSEQELLARVQQLRQDPQPQGTQQQYMQMIAGRRAQLVKLANEFLARYPDSKARDEVIQAKLESMYISAALKGQNLNALQQEAERLLAGQVSPAVAAHAAYWRLHCLLVKKRQDLQASTKLSTTQRAEQYRDFALQQLGRYVNSYPKSEFSPQMLEALFTAAQRKGDQDATARYAAHLHKHFPDHAITKAIDGRLRRQNGVGKPFKLAFTSTAGQKIDLQQMPGKVILIDFWASWCPPCRVAMPKLKALYQKYHPKGLEIIGVSLDRSRTDMDAYLKTAKLPWPIFFDTKATEELARAWGIEAIPTYFVIDKRGLLRSTDAGGKLDELVPKLLTEKTPKKLQ
ncbi:MAG: TlpA family protein disulfide reductase [Phycisphaerae bacterium]